jgi:hypothetical protein
VPVQDERGGISRKCGNLGRKRVPVAVPVPVPDKGMRGSCGSCCSGGWCRNWRNTICIITGGITGLRGRLRSRCGARCGERCSDGGGRWIDNARRRRRRRRGNSDGHGLCCGRCGGRVGLCRSGSGCRRRVGGRRRGVGGGGISRYCRRYHR